MDAFMFRAALYCPDCIVEALIQARVLSPAAREMGLEKAREQWMDANGFESESDYDSEEMAKGPYADGGGESDSAQHCDTCGEPLDNPVIG